MSNDGCMFNKSLNTNNPDNRMLMADSRQFLTTLVNKCGNVDI